MVFSLLLTFCVTTLNAQQPPQTPASPADRGKKIGEIVKAAIETAFPAAQTVIDAFWRPATDRNKSKGQVNSGLEEARRTFKQQALAQMQAAGVVADELEVVQKFARAAVKAEVNIGRMKALMTVSSQGSPDWVQLGREWGFAKNHLAEVLGVDTSKVRDEVVRGRLTDLQDSKTELMGRIDDTLHDARDKDALRDYINSMENLLAGLDSIGAAELQTLSHEITDLVKWANQPAGNNETPLVLDKDLLIIASDAHKAANSVLGKYANEKKQ
jgi:hypothetical protein